MADNKSTMTVAMDAKSLARLFSQPEFLGSKFLYTELETIFTRLIEKGVFDGEQPSVKKLGSLLNEAIEYSGLSELVADFQMSLDDYNNGDVLDDVMKADIIDDIESSEPDILAVVCTGSEEEPIYVIREGWFDEDEEPIYD